MLETAKLIPFEYLKEALATSFKSFFLFSDSPLEFLFSYSFVFCNFWGVSPAVCYFSNLKQVKDLCAHCKVSLVFPNPLHVCLLSAETPEKPRITNPGLLTEGQPVTVNCTTEYTCPSNPPTVDWGGVNGTVILQYTAKQQVAWAVTSSITFTPSYRDSQIQCQVKYPGRNNVTEHRPIHVKCK